MSLTNGQPETETSEHTHCQGGSSHPVPLNEEARLSALRNLGILDTPTDPRFDRITRLAAIHFGTPLARITFVDEHRTWYKSCYGPGATESPREIAICAHAVMSNEVLVSCDLSQDPRFRDSPQVAGAPHLRFYAGAPITLKDGMRVGSLCIIDLEPRSDFSDEDRMLLTDLAEIVVHELELHKQIVHREHSLLDAEREIATAQNAKKRFLSLVSHELKTPLNHILGFGRLLANMDPDALEHETRAEYANCICQSAERLEALIRRILSYSSADAGDLVLSETVIDTGAMVAKCRGLVEPRARAAEVEVKVADSNPAEHHLFADDVQIEEVLVQVLDNAIAFSPSGGTVELAVGSTQTGGIAVRVFDRGPGVDPGEVERVISAFAQGDESLSRNHEGIGLGLPMSRAIMELHGGSLTLEARPGGGTVVEAAFPANRCRSGSEGAPSNNDIAPPPDAPVDQDQESTGSCPAAQSYSALRQVKPSAVVRQTNSAGLGTYPST